MAADARYRPIADYAAIGNLRTVALVCRDGSLDWLCLPHLDEPSVFAALLDARRGGRFRVRARGGAPGDQRYLGDSNVLETSFPGRDGGRLEVTDFMPVAGSLEGCAHSRARPELQRILACRDQPLEVEIEWSPRFDYARATPRIERGEGGWIATAGGARLALAGLGQGSIVDDGHGPAVRARLALAPGERRALVCRWDSTELGADLAASLAACRATTAAWQEWAHGPGLDKIAHWAEEWTPLVVRSALVLKLLSNADSGAIAAAPTTSLPETIGGVRNWDYRYAWIRDASMTAQALVSLGHTQEAIDLLLWMERAAEAHAEGWRLQIMYGVHGEADLRESELDHLEGYRGSRPVRIGNLAAEQFQLEVYGELLTTGYELARRGHRLAPELARFLGRVADHVEDVWEQPDSGIWELRREPRHHVYSKSMAWVALDRAVRLARRHGLPGDHRRWRRVRDRIRAQILERGYDPDRGAFVMHYGSRALDAANLRLPLLELLPADDPRVLGTIDRIREELGENGLVHRYRIDDGLPGEEGAFGLCSFWLVDALSLAGRKDEAHEIFESMAGRANHVGLFPEQFDPGTGEFLGNFPQAFTHIGLINSALYVAYHDERTMPEHPPIGTPEHRAASAAADAEAEGT